MRSFKADKIKRYVCNWWYNDVVEWPDDCTGEFTEEHWFFRLWNVLFFTMAAVVKTYAYDFVRTSYGRKESHIFGIYATMAICYDSIK